MRENVPTKLWSQKIFIWNLNQGSLFFSFSISSCLRVVNFLLLAQEFKQGSQNLSRYQINFYRFVPIKLYFERLAMDSVLHGTVWKSHRYRIAINPPRFRVCNQIFSCMVKLLSTYRVKVPQCMGSPLFWLHGENILHTDYSLTLINISIHSKLFYYYYFFNKSK